MVLINLFWVLSFSFLHDEFTFTGDIIYLENFGSPLVIVNSHDVAVDLLEKRSAKYSSRPVGYMSDILYVHSSVLSVQTSKMNLVSQDWTWLAVFTPYGNRWRNYRGPIQKAFNSADVSNYLDIQRHGILILLANLLRHPDESALYVRS